MSFLSWFILNFLLGCKGTNKKPNTTYLIDNKYKIEEEALKGIESIEAIDAIETIDAIESIEAIESIDPPLPTALRYLLT